MAQQSGMMSLLVQDVNGKPQVIKVQTSQTKSVTPAGFRPNQTIRAVIKQEDGTQILSNTGSIIPQGQVLRTLGSFQGSKTGQQRGHLVTIPIQTPSGMKVQAQVIQRSVQKSFFQPVLDQSATRKRPEGENGIITQYKRRRTDKCGKGLRHFSMKVMEKVKKKGTTSYNEVADELVTEFSNQQILASSTEQYDQKNIRRRVYDALNVLMAMNIISKEKKEIRWLGLPTNSMQDYLSLVKVKSETTKRIKTKTQQLHDLILQQISFKKLVERNYEAERRGGVPPPNSSIQLPFIIVNTNKKAVIDCSISNDKTEYLFAFNDKFEIHDDIEVLKRMGLVMGLDNGTCSNEDFEKAKSMVPKSVEKYVIQLANGSLHCESMAGPSSEDLAAVATLEEIQQSMSPLALDPEAESSEGDESDMSSDLDNI